MKRIAIVAGVSILVPSLACAQVRADPRKDALDAAVARGDQAIANGQKEQASAAWSLVLAFEPSHAEAKKKIDALPGAGFSASSEETAFASSAIGKTGSADWCGFPEPMPAMELVAIRMLPTRVCYRVFGLQACRSAQAHAAVPAHSSSLQDQHCQLPTFASGTVRHKQSARRLGARS